MSGAKCPVILSFSLTKMADRVRKVASTSIPYEPESSSSSSSSKRRCSTQRQLTNSTFQKWQRVYKQEHQMVTWLRCELDRDNVSVVLLYCSTCKKYECKISSLKNFTNAWIIGSTNLKSTNVPDHANSLVHKAAIGYMRAECLKASRQSPMMCSPIGRLLTTLHLDAKTQARMKIKFDVCYVMAKQGIDFSKYPALLELEARHDADLGIAYSTPDSAKSFTGYITKSQRQDFLTKFCSESHFYSVLTDGTTDAGNLEDELIILVYCCKNDTTQEITAKTRYWSIHNPEKADADGILKCLSESLQLLGVKNVMDKQSVLGVEDKPVLVGSELALMGASVNVGGINGLRGKIQKELPRIYWSWCYTL